MPPAANTIDRIAHQVLLHCPLAGKPLATLWAANAFAKLASLRDRWSWLIKFGQFNIPNVYATGTVTITSADPTLLIGTGTVWTQSMVGRQFTLGLSNGYDLVEFIDSTHMRIGLPWGDPDVTNVGYQILQRYVTVPSDFAMFLSVLDPTRNQRLRTGIERRELDLRDPRRTTTGQPYVVAEAGYAPAYAGSVDATPFQVKGSGAVPTFGGAYSGPTDTIYTVEITTGGASGTAVFSWRRGTGAAVTGVTTDSEGVGLTGNVVVAFPNDPANPYDVGDIFVARATVGQSSFGSPRYELWPTQLTQTVYPYYYLAGPPDLSVLTNATLPNSIRPDVVLKGALAEAAAWAGRGDQENPLYDLKAAAKNTVEFERMVDILALRDDDLFPADVTYVRDLPFAGPPWDAAWEQAHA
jgi:hypothetical protein